MRLIRMPGEISELTARTVREDIAATVGDARELERIYDGRDV